MREIRELAYDLYRVDSLSEKGKDGELYSSWDSLYKDYPDWAEIFMTQAKMLYIAGWRKDAKNT